MQQQIRNNLIAKKKICISCENERVIFSKGSCKNCWNKLNSSKYKLKQNKPTKPKIKKITVSKLKKDARYWFQRWIRLRDLNNESCYGTGIQLTDIRYYDACHYLKFELYPEAGFDERNVHGGDKGSNIRDDVPRYRAWLIKTKGEQFVNELENKYVINRETDFKLDREFLQNIITTYRERCKNLENNLSK